VVSGERIVRVGPDSDIKPSANAEIIDAKGRFLMPGCGTIISILATTMARSTSPMAYQRARYGERHRYVS
jgi:Predicted metal-dependent hydrolase with the TIM-barrel fold